MNENTLRFPCPLCGAPVSVTVDNITIEVVPPEPGKGLKRASLKAIGIGVTNHVHGRSNNS